MLSILPIVDNFRLLRVLNLVAIETPDGTLPKEIGSLILLRYLGLLSTNITQLPSSIGNLRNLLTLDYRSDPDNSEGYAKIPKGVWEIEGLRHIYLPCDPQEGTRFHTLHQLQSLWVQGASSWMLDELPKLSKSVQKLRIQGITNNEQLEVVFRCPSIKFDRLHSLALHWNNRVREDEGESGPKKEVVLKNLACIVNSRHLRKLVMSGRIDDRAACFQFPFGIKKIVLQSTKIEKEATLEALGRLPSLKVLQLLEDSYIGTKWSCYEGLFSHLNELRMWELPKLEEWSIEKGAMCQLNKLFICDCRRLTGLPEGLKFVTTLKELKLVCMEDEFCRKIRAEDGEDAHIIQNIPVVKFFDDAYQFVLALTKR